MVKLFRSHRRLTPKEKLNAIFSTYNSLTDFSQKRLGVMAVSREVKIPWTAVQQLLVRLKQRDFDVERIIGRPKRPDKKPLIIGSAELEKHLVSKECL